MKIPAGQIISKNKGGPHVGHDYLRARRLITKLAAVFLVAAIADAARGGEHIVFDYDSRSALMADGWSFLAKSASGIARDTEQTNGALVSYSQELHPGLLRIPADAGDLWADLNNTRNSLFRALPAKWISVRLKLAAFSPSQNYQQAGLVVYQDDDNYVQICRIYDSGDRVTFATETAQNPTLVQVHSEDATTNLHFRLDRDPMTETISAYYSLDNASWVNLGSVNRSLASAQLGIVVGASTGGLPNADFAWVDVLSQPVVPTLSLSRGHIEFTVAVGDTAAQSQSVDLLNSGTSDSLSWSQTGSTSWLKATPSTGTTPGTITVSANPAGLAQGLYTGAVTITSQDAVNTPQTLVATLRVEPAGSAHYAFNYPDRATLLADGWSFLALTASGGDRDTEQTTGAVVSYDQAAHPGVLRIPVDMGDLWGNMNDTRNSLFRSLPSKWSRVRLKLESFSPVQDYQQAGLVVYQDDDNYVQLTRVFDGTGRVSFVKEAAQAVSVIGASDVSASTGLQLQLDRDRATDTITGYYSLDGVNWTQVASAVQALKSTRVGIVVGGSPGGFPSADIAWVEFQTSDFPLSSVLAVYPSNLVFNAVQGHNTDVVQTLNVIHRGLGTVTWSQSDDAAWLRTSPAEGATPATLAATVDPIGLPSGIHTGTITFTSPDADGGLNAKVTMIVNPDVPVGATAWRGGRAGAFSISTDDGSQACFSELLSLGLAGSFYYIGTNPPAYFVDMQASEMEVGCHTVTHTSQAESEATFRSTEIEPNILGLCDLIPTLPCEQTAMSLAWPYGFNTIEEQSWASDYFLAARGYNINQLEDQTPRNFMNLKSFNSHEHAPYPPDDLKTVVDMAEAQGKWGILTFHSVCNDDNAIYYASTKDVWVAPIATVAKYIQQRNRFVLLNYQATVDQISFSYRRLEIPPSPIRSFEAAVQSSDQLTLAVDIDDAWTIDGFTVNGVAQQYQTRTISGNKVLLFDTAVDTSVRTALVVHGQSQASLWLQPTSLLFSAVAGGAAPASKSIDVTATGGSSNVLAWSQNDNAQWLLVTPAAGTTPDQLTVSADPAGLTPGTYTGTITVTANGAVNTPQLVGVTLIVDPPSPAIVLSPTDLTFSATAGGSNPAGKMLAVSNGGGGTLNWTATVGDSGPAWLSVSPTAGTGSTALAVSVNMAGLATGTYTGTVIVSAAGATNTPQTATVTLTVNPPSPAIVLSPPDLTFNVTAGGSNPVSKVLAVSNGGGGTLNWIATVGGSGPAWLSVSPTAGTGSTALAVSVNMAGLATGTYTGTVIVSAAGATNTPQTASVTLTVKPSGPVIALSPTNLAFSATAGSSNPDGQTLTLSNGGSGTLKWTATVGGSGAAWLSVRPTSGTGDKTLTVSVNTAGLTTGTYSRTIVVAAKGANNTPQTVVVTLTLIPPVVARYDFAYPDRASLLADGWDYLARTAVGLARDTETTSGAVVSFDQVAHPGVLRIPADTGDLWANRNNTRNSLFQNIPATWFRVQIKLSFAPTRDYQQAGLVAYQDDDNYVQVTRTYSQRKNRVAFIREFAGSALTVNQPTVTSTNLYLRLDRNATTGTISGFYSVNGTTWSSLGSVSRVLNNPRVGIIVGNSPGGFPNADVASVEVFSQ